MQSEFPVWFILFSITVLFIGGVVRFPRTSERYVYAIWPSVVIGLGYITLAIMWILYLTNGVPPQ